MIQYALNKFNLNPILVNVNKLKPYMFLDEYFRGLEAQLTWEIKVTNGITCKTTKELGPK
jgi:hypothetical protein